MHPTLSHLLETKMADNKKELDRRRLVGFVKLRPESTVSPQELKDFVAERLPRHMVPSQIEFVDAMPVLPNGKLDRHALKHVALSQTQLLSNGETDLSPEDRLLLDTVCALFSDVLEQDVQPSDDFFALGGHSILAVQLFGRLSAEIGIELPISILFDHPSPLAIVEQVVQQRGAATSSLRANVLVTIRKEGNLAPLFIVHGAGGNILKFEKLAHGLKSSRPVHGLQAKNVDGVSEPHESIEAMAEEYLEAINSVYPKGIVNLAGYSGGGIVAIELARRLRMQNRLGQTVMIDTFCPTVSSPKPIENVSRRKQHLKRLLTEGPKYVLTWIRERIRYERYRKIRTSYYSLKNSDQPIPHELRSIGLMADFDKVVTRYDMKTLNFPVDLIAADEDRHLHDEWHRWTTAPFAIHWVSGDHYNILAEPMVRTVSSLLDAILADKHN